MSRFDPTPLDDQQARHLKGAAAAWRRYLVAAAERSEVNGAMAWKKVKGREYLVHSHYDRAVGAKRSTSLGVRSPETERRLSAFEQRRAAAEVALDEAKAPLDRLTRVGKALQIGRLNNTGAEVLRELQSEQVLGADLYVIDSSAVAAYEARAAVFLPKGLEADPARMELCVTGEGDPQLFDDLQSVLRRVDKSFRRRDEDTFVNERGFEVALYTRSSMLDWVNEAGFDGDKRAVLRVAIQAPPVGMAAIARNGMPLRMVCLDPRNFAVIHYAKAMSRLEPSPDRAYAVGRLVENYWPEKFSPDVAIAFPKFAERVGIAPPEVDVEDPDVPDPEEPRFYGP
ncbi:GSU2403 family nucleotidyltransferase fold protein [Bradyrhizobium sp. 143]|uniref:GSU2403 family nucleotidyltransferase fold protein n=1 Tax=Bradyrhizobium sp. 143 TaxID=2782619 RepID=UPI001FF74E71|nr:GSU2403 family nucleotidyltransferase fold protein [Bradyrhizobium sp. 143]MCK1713122.1 hypothetical protein [Bradyrhizobium sp. 143]